MEKPLWNSLGENNPLYLEAERFFLHWKLKCFYVIRILGGLVLLNDNRVSLNWMDFKLASVENHQVSALLWVEELWVYIEGKMSKK